MFSADRNRVQIDEAEGDLGRQDSQAIDEQVLTANKRFAIRTNIKKQYTI